MAHPQAVLPLSPPRELSDENEQEAEARWNHRILRATEDACDEIGRAAVCYALNLSEGTLSKKLRGVEEKVCDARIQNYALKHQKSGRLAKVLAEYADYLPFERPEKVDPEEALREIVALATSGAMGTDAQQKVLAIYGRTAKRSIR